MLDLNERPSLRRSASTLSSTVAQSWQLPATISIARLGIVVFTRPFDGPAVFLWRIEKQLAFSTGPFPNRHRYNENGHRVLVGLSVKETFEFETLDDLAPLDETGNHIPWRDGVPITSREKRWLELYLKHEDAWETLVAKRYARQPTPPGL